MERPVSYSRFSGLWSRSELGKRSTQLDPMFRACQILRNRVEIDSSAIIALLGAQSWRAWVERCLLSRPCSDTARSSYLISNNPGASSKNMITTGVYSPFETRVLHQRSFRLATTRLVNPAVFGRHHQAVPTTHTGSDKKR